MKLRDTHTNDNQQPNDFVNNEVQTIDHLGLVAAAIKKLGLVAKIDARLPLDPGSFVTHGQRVAAMLINGQGYTTAPLYLTPSFFENKDVEKLIGPGVEATHLNDFALGRTLDAIYDYGTTRLFVEIAFEVAKEHNLLGSSLHIDTTTLMLHGEFLEAAELVEAAKEMSPEHAAAVTDTPTPTLGYSKAHRHDLKQVVMSLTVTGKAKMPVWFESLPGNSSDKTNFHESIAKFEAIKGHIASCDNFLWVADSALYNDEKLQGTSIKWLTRVPQTKGYAKALVNLPDESIAWEALGNGYKGATLFDIQNKNLWCLVFSEQAYKKELVTFDRKVAKAREKAEKSLRKLCREPFACEADALKAKKQWEKGLKYHKGELTVVERERFNKRGKPPTGAEPDYIEYHLSGEVEDDKEAQDQLRHHLGRFILATNDTDNEEMTAQQILETYKEQQGVEQGFRFVKSSEFHLDSIYLKLPSRIDALMMIMTLTLMVYNSTEYQMRETMAELSITLPNQKKKQTAQPTLRWVFQMMQGIHTLKIPGMEQRVTGLNENRVKIIRLFGEVACEIYGLKD